MAAEALPSQFQLHKHYRMAAEALPSQFPRPTPTLHRRARTSPLINGMHFFIKTHMSRVGQNRKYTPYMTINSVVSLPKPPYIHHIYIYMVLANLTYVLERTRASTEG
jgi:hypothetical protein